MSTHTPGPWVLEPNASGGTNFRCSWGVIGCVLPGNSFVPGGPNQVPEQAANARLIAAAPDLLAALIDVIGWVPGAAAWHTDAPLKAVDKARAAIAKATGTP